MESDVLTLKDLAIQLDLPESTLRKYRDAFPQYIPTVGSGRDRRYRPEASDVFEMIRDCRTKEHLSWEDTGRELAKKFPVDAESIDKHGLPVPDRVPVSAQAAAILRRLESANEDTAFILNTIGSEIVNLSQTMKRYSTTFDDIGIIRRTVYAQDNEIRNIRQSLLQLLQIAEQAPEQAISPDQTALLSQLARIQSSMAYLARQFENRPEQDPASSTPAAAPELAKFKNEIVRLRTLMKEKEDEIAQLHATNRRMKLENDELKTRLGELSKIDILDAVVDEQVIEKEKPTGGKFFFKGKKKQN